MKNNDYILEAEEIIPFIKYKVLKNLPYLLDVTFEKTYKNIVNYSSNEWQTINENAPKQSKEVSKKQTDIKSNEKESANQTKPSQTGVTKPPTGPANLTNTQDLKNTGIGLAAAATGFGVRQTGIKQGYFHGMGDAKISGLTPEQKADIISKSGGESATGLSGAKFVGDDSVTVSASTLNKTLGGAGSDTLGDSTVSYGTDFSNAIGGTATGIVAGMATRMVIKAIGSKLKKRREAKEKLKQGIVKENKLRDIKNWIVRNPVTTSLLFILFTLSGMRTLVSMILNNSPEIKSIINGMDAYVDENGTVDVKHEVNGKTPRQFLYSQLEKLFSGADDGAKATWEKVKNNYFIREKEKEFEALIFNSSARVKEIK